MNKIPRVTLSFASQVLTLDEGFKNKPYLDTKAFWTIGIGHLIGTELKEFELSHEIILRLFEEDMERHYNEAIILFGEDYLLSLEPARQVAILSLVFSLGRIKLSGFIHTLPALKEKNWELATKLLLQTKWAHDVDPKQVSGQGRDDRIAFMLLTGKFHEDYKITDSVPTTFSNAGCV